MSGDYRKIVQAVAYLASKSGEGGLNRLHAFKLLFLADRDHLRRCGSSITGDSYHAMKYGPVPVSAEHLLKSRHAPEADRKYASEHLQQKLVGKNKAMLYCKNLDADQLSKSDLESLDVAWRVYQSKDDIIAYTHSFPEWLRASKKLTEGVVEVPMNTEDFFLAAPKDVEYCAADAEWVKLSKELYVETAWVDTL